MHQRQKQWIGTLAACGLVFMGLTSCTAPGNQASFTTTLGSSPIAKPVENPRLRIWWSQGFLPEENELVAKLVDRWRKETGKDAELRLIPQSIINSETQKAIDNGNPPDIVYSATGETNLAPALAWKNQLADVSDLIIPNKDRYTPEALKAVYYQNSKTKTRSYYAVPIGQQGTHIFYWRSYLAEAGFSEADIPQDWNQFWKFWQEVHARLQAKGKKDIYGLGLCMSDLGTDTFLGVEAFLEAYNAKILDDSGQLLVDQPETRTRIIQALQKYASFYQSKDVPPKAIEWKDSGNNVSFLEGQSIMTINGTLSIPLTQNQENNKYNKISNDLYFNKIVTSGWPRKPDGQPLKTIILVKQIILFENSQHKEDAKSFLKFLIKPDNLNEFLQKGAKGRTIPVMPQLFKDPYWTNANDPHIPTAIRQLQGIVRPSYEVLNPAYSEVLSKNIWAKAVLSIIQENKTPEAAADKAIGQIKDIFKEWQEK